MSTVGAVTGPGQPADNPPPASVASELAAAAKADLLDVLPDLSAWRLDQDRWSRIEQILNDLNAAMARADAGALHRATTDLERASPMLIHLIGATQAVPAPEPLREQASRLVESLRAADPRPFPSSGAPPRPAVAGGEGGGPRPW